MSEIEPENAMGARLHDIPILEFGRPAMRTYFKRHDDVSHDKVPCGCSLVLASAGRKPANPLAASGSVGDSKGGVQ